MKKITLILSILTIVFASCKDKNAYTIDGNFNEATFDGKMVYLQKVDNMSSTGPVVLDSATVKDGKFRIEGVTEEQPSIRFVSLGKLAEMENAEPDQPTIATFVLEPGTIQLTFTKGILSLSGTPRNDEFNKVHVLSNQMEAIYKEVMAAGNIGNVPDATKAKMEELMGQMEEENYKFLKENMDNPAGEFIFTSSLRSFNEEQITELLALSSETFKNKPEIKEIVEVLEEQEKQKTAILKHPVQDANVKDMAGKTVALSSLIGNNKVVLLDFWASWCGPCIAEIPNLVQAYAKYKEKGFEIVGVSVDEDKSAWKEAIKKHDMTWIHLIDEANDAAKAFNISSIPYTLLVDKNGNVYAMNLRGAALEEKLEELLK